MARKDPTPVRFDADVAERLASFTAAHPGVSLSLAANRFVDEGLRMAEYPGITFRDGPSGRRAGLAGGADIWEIVRAVRTARTHEPELDEAELLALVATNTAIAERSIRLAVHYWAAYPAEIDAEIDAATTAEQAAEQAWLRERRLLAG